MTLNWEYRKNTWFLFALVAALAALKENSPAVARPAELGRTAPGTPRSAARFVVPVSEV
jgi:hypothetical protein